MSAAGPADPLAHLRQRAAAAVRAHREAEERQRMVARQQHQAELAKRRAEYAGLLREQLSAVGIPTDPADYEYADDQPLPEADVGGVRFRIAWVGQSSPSPLLQAWHPGAPGCGIGWQRVRTLVELGLFLETLPAADQPPDPGPLLSMQELAARAARHVEQTIEATNLENRRLGAEHARAALVAAVTRMAGDPRLVETGRIGPDDDELLFERDGLVIRLDPLDPDEWGDGESRLQLRGICAACDERVWSGRFRTLPGLHRLLTDFQAGAEHARSHPPVEIAEQAEGGAEAPEAAERDPLRLASDAEYRL